MQPKIMIFFITCKKEFKLRQLEIYQANKSNSFTQKNISTCLFLSHCFSWGGPENRKMRREGNEHCHPTLEGLLLLGRGVTVGAGGGQAEAALTIDETPPSKQASRNHQHLIHWSSSNGLIFLIILLRWPGAGTFGIKPSRAVMSRSSGGRITL